MTWMSKLGVMLLVLVAHDAAFAQNTLPLSGAGAGHGDGGKGCALRHVGIRSPLAMDVYRPSKAASVLPALIFFNQSVGAQRQRAFNFYVRWAETAAMNGLISIVPDLRSDSAAADFQILIRAPDELRGAVRNRSGCNCGLRRLGQRVRGAAGDAGPCADDRQGRGHVLRHGQREEALRLDLPLSDGARRLRSAGRQCGHGGAGCRGRLRRTLR